jgi:hypothetical protein
LPNKLKSKASPKRKLSQSLRFANKFMIIFLSRPTGRVYLACIEKRERNVAPLQAV